MLWVSSSGGTKCSIEPLLADGPEVLMCTQNSREDYILYIGSQYVTEGH